MPMYIFISVTSRFFTCELVIGSVSIPNSMAERSSYGSSPVLTCGGIFVSHRTRDIFPQLFHPHCALRPLVYKCIHFAIALQGASRYLNSVTCGSWPDCILTLPNGIPFRHMSVFALDTSLSSPRLPSTARVPTPVRLSPLYTAPHHQGTSSAKVLFSDVFRQ